MSDRWHVLDQGDSYVLARRLPVRFDVAASTRLPLMRRDRLARQIRQDVWRALQSVRGFSPAVKIVTEGADLVVTAGGAVQARSFPRQMMEDRLTDLLHDPDRRERWRRWAS